MTKIIIDTNFLLIPSQFGVDIFTELKRITPDKCELFIVDKTVYELEKIIKEQTGKNKAAAKLGLELLKKKTLKTLKTENNLNVDKLIENLTKQGEYLVATQDKELKKILKATGTKLVVLRQKKHLKII